VDRYGPETYGERIAERYDDLHRHLDPGAAVEALARLAGDAGEVLELGIGSGRIALPLAERGLTVHGIDASEAMLTRLRAKRNGRTICVWLGDFADVAVEGRFGVVFVAFNTFFALTTQADQVRCFENVSPRLADEGVFVIEAFVPDVARFDRGQRVSAIDVGLDEVAVDIAKYDAASQRIVKQHVRVTGSGIELLPVVIRFAWPAELDLMARLAGLRLRERWGGWDGRPFNSDSGQHVSVYERAQLPL